MSDPSLLKSISPCADSSALCLFPLVSDQMATSTNASASTHSGESEEFPVANNPTIANRVLAFARVIPADDDDMKPLWRYVQILQKTRKGQEGNAKMRCRLCNKGFQGSYSRVKAHL